MGLEVGHYQAVVFLDGTPVVDKTPQLEADRRMQTEGSKQKLAVTPIDSTQDTQDKLTPDP